MRYRSRSYCVLYKCVLSRRIVIRRYEARRCSLGPNVHIFTAHMSTGHFGRAVPVGLRRFPLLRGKTLGGTKMEFPTDLKPQDAPFHVVTLNFKNKHVWNARTWAGLHSSLELLQQHNEKNIGSMFHVFIFPRFFMLWSPWWKRRCRSWAEENYIPPENVMVVYGDRDAICEDIGIFNDGRQYGFIMRNSGKVLFAAHGRYLSHKHDFQIHKAIRTLQEGEQLENNSD